MIKPADPETARTMIREYATSLGVDLSFQDIEHELATLDTFYEAMFAAMLSAAPAACAATDRGATHAGFVALRKIDDEVCEMKRLYVRPQFRGQNIGRKLAQHIIEESRKRGYKRMRLDTLPTMAAARSLYRELGFVEIAPYRFNPIEGTAFMELDLRSMPAPGE